MVLAVWLSSRESPLLSELLELRVSSRKNLREALKSMSLISKSGAEWPLSHCFAWALKRELSMTMRLSGLMSRWQTPWVWRYLSTESKLNAIFCITSSLILAFSLPGDLLCPSPRQPSPLSPGLTL